MAVKEQQRQGIPLSLKLAYTALYIGIVYFTVSNYTWLSLLWFSQTALFVVLIGMWAESRLLISMASLNILVFHSLWSLGFFMRLIVGTNFLGGIEYMFDPYTSLFLRGISLYHVVLPLVIIWLLSRKGYYTGAWKHQTLLAWAVLVFVFIATPPAKNINWAFGPWTPQTAISPYLYLVVVMIVIPVVIYLPTHLILKRFFSEG